MANGREDWIESWRESARKVGRRSIWITLALLLPAIALAVSLTRFSADAVDERDRRIALLDDSLARMSEVPSVPPVTTLPDTADALSQTLHDENIRLRDSLTNLSDSLSGTKRESDEARRLLEALLKRLRGAVGTNEELCRNLSGSEDILRKLVSVRGIDSALVRRVLADAERNDLLCDRLLNQLRSIADVTRNAPLE